MSFLDPTEVIPHRKPFLMIDKVVDMTQTRCVAVRTFRPEEEVFKGHFPQKAIVPGVLLIEGMAQTMAYFALSRKKNEQVFLVGIEKARFRSVVEPGKEVTFEITVDGEERWGMLTGKGVARVAGKKVADAVIMGYHADPSAQPPQ